MRCIRIAVLQFQRAAPPSWAPQIGGIWHWYQRSLENCACRKVLQDEFNIFHNYLSGTALLGPKGAMACTVAVESVIVDHYNDQLRALMADPVANK